MTGYLPVKHSLYIRAEIEDGLDDKDEKLSLNLGCLTTNTCTHNRNLLDRPKQCI